jgi:23S rRNA G2069 N7-methylase RlmK/C1962 C5-methylase RlmI
MARHYDKWARRQGLEVYRIYDADLEDHPLTVDRYGTNLYVALYAPKGKEMDEESWRETRQNYRETIMETLNAGRDEVFFKLRQRAKGGEQYDKLAWVEREFTVAENTVDFLVNLTDYLDTGLYPDHRETRLMIGKQAEGKTVLNLFAYTCTFSVFAAVGGAEKVYSVDLSNTYLEWGKRNFAANGIDTEKHAFIRTDVKSWLANPNSFRYDLIILDPPTFMNSKSMSEVLDLQRDHLELIQNCLRRLVPEGQLFFSTNSRRFRLDEAALSELAKFKEITKQTAAPDFRNRVPHRCWLIEHKGEG